MIYWSMNVDNLSSLNKSETKYKKSDEKKQFSDLRFRNSEENTL
jgi:hypothetical protein